MSSLTNVGEQQVVDWLATGTTAAPVLPYKLRLVTANGSETAAGTEVTGGSYPAGGKDCVMGASSLAGDGRYESGNTTLIRYDNMPAVTVVGVELWDSGGTPRRFFYGPLDVSRTLVAGDPVEFAANTVKIRAD